MLRATSAFLVVLAAVLLITWGVSPAESQQARPSAAVPAPAIEFPAELADVNTEVDRLTSRLARPAELPGPARDPFSFSSRVRPMREMTPATTVALVPPVESVRPSWPTLVAIMTRASDGAYEVALADARDELVVVGAGATVGAFVVTDVTADAVVLSDPASGQTTRLSVR